MAAKKSTIYIHIGTIKTGTTSLQHFFHLNRSKLVENFNIYYPKTPGLKNHTKLPLYAYEKNVAEMRIRHKIHTTESLEQLRSTFKNKLEEEIKPYITEGKDILFSSEHLSSRAVEAYEIERLLSLFESFEVNIKIIVYLRRQDKMMLSTYSTWVKSGGKWKLNPNAYKNRRYNHLVMIKLWADVVGRKQMVVKVFEKEKMVNNDLFHDFCACLGISDLSSLSIPPNTMLNSSLDEEQIQFLTLFNKFIPAMEDGKVNATRGQLITYLESFSNENKLDISFAEKQKIYQHFENENNQIADLYIGDGAPLFSPLNQATEERKPIKLTAEKAVEISAYLWSKQQEELQSKTKWTTGIKKSLKKIFRL